MFEFGVKKLDVQVNELLNSISSKVDDSKYPDAAKLVKKAIDDHENNHQLPQTVANKLTNSLRFLKLEDEKKLPDSISEEISELRNLINKGGVGYVSHGAQSLTSQYQL